MKGWTAEVPEESAGLFRVLFHGENSHGVALTRGVNEDGEPGEVWRISLARRKRPGFVRIAEQGAELGREELAEIRQYIDEALEAP